MPASESVPSVALRPWPAAKKEKLEAGDVLAQVMQLTEERGHLRNITENSLQAEIDSGKDASADVMEGIEEDDRKDGPTKEERLKELQSARQQMYEQADWALFAASNMLDLLALVLTRDPKKVVDSSFSARFKSMRIPHGSLAISKEVERPKTDEEIPWQQYAEERDRLAGRGSRMEALDWATDNILKAATQMETEVRKEVKYWDEILSISQKGWSLQRFRKNSPHSPFAVRYGFRGASDHFEARGLAPLRMDDDGSIILDPALALQPKTLRVRISVSGKITGTSSLAVRETETESAIEKSIQLARDSLFEEELYHEISMETRQLHAYGVELRNSVVHLTDSASSDDSGHRTILIDCIARDEAVEGSDDHTHDWLAHNVAEALRLLLTHEHRMRLFRKSLVPPPLSLQKRQTQSPPLLRTLLAIFSHISSVNALGAYLDNAVKILNSAGLNTALHMTGETSWENMKKIVHMSTRKDLSPLDHILDFFVKPFDGVATLSLPSASGSEPENLAIAVRTFFGQPTYGTEYKVTLGPSLASALNLSIDQKRDFKFSSVEEVKSYTDWLLSLDLSQNLLFKEYARKATIRSKEPRVTISVRDGKKTIKKDVAVQLADGELRVIVGPAPLLGESASAQVFAWSGNAEDPSFKEKVQSFLAQWLDSS